MKGDGGNNDVSLMKTSKVKGDMTRIAALAIYFSCGGYCCVQNCIYLASLFMWGYCVGVKLHLFSLACKTILGEGRLAII